MPKPEDIARQEVREFLVVLRDSLGQPPLDGLMATAAVNMVWLLAEQDLGKRLAARDRLDELLTDPPLITRPMDWPEGQR